MDERILIVLTYIIDIDDTLKLTQSQGHKVKGQGHISHLCEKLFRLNLMNRWMDLEETLCDGQLCLGT